jgi:hypothetical protein
VRECGSEVAVYALFEWGLEMVFRVCVFIMRTMNGKLRSTSRSYGCYTTSCFIMSDNRDMYRYHLLATVLSEWVIHPR